jgi:hypothetical protein
MEFTKDSYNILLGIFVYIINGIYKYKDSNYILLVMIVYIINGIYKYKDFYDYINNVCLYY